MNDDCHAWRNDLEARAREMGAKAFGIADLDDIKKTAPTALDRVPGDYTRAVVIGMALQRAALAGIVDQPTPLYFHNYRQLNYQLDRVAWTLADLIQADGFSALAVPASQIIERNPMRGHISHRLLGQAAGIGFIGRNGLLVHPTYGSQMRYVSILTDRPLEPDKAYVGDCGSCRACLAVCPAGAIHERKDDFDLTACFNKLTEFTKLSFIGQHVCGVCVRACKGKE